MYYAYVLKSEKDDNFYYGSTNNIKRRAWQHNEGLVKSTKNRRPLVFGWNERIQYKVEELECENYFKKCKNKKFILKLINMAPSYRG